jgi:hypothetical protein
MARGAPDYAASRIPARAHLGYDEPVEILVTQIAGAPIEILDSPAVPANKIWHITNVVLMNATSIQPAVIGSTITAAGSIAVMANQNIPTNEAVYLRGEFWMEATDIFRGTFIAAAGGDSIQMTMHGTQIDIEI